MRNFVIGKNVFIDTDEVAFVWFEEGVKLTIVMKANASPITLDNVQAAESIWKSLHKTLVESLTPAT